MSANPMTKQAWLDYLEKTFDEFDWSAAGTSPDEQTQLVAAQLIRDEFGGRDDDKTR